MENWERNVPLAVHTTLKVGGPAEYLATVRTEDELIARIAEAQAENLSITILGGGSNVLVSDDGVRGAVIQNKIRGIEEQVNGEEVVLSVGAGEVFDELVAHTVSKGYWGLENLSHIPGSVGATPIQNVGAYGVEVGEFVESVRVFNMETNEFETLTRDACLFGYRDSIFKHAAGGRYVVVNVTLRVSTVSNPRLAYKDLAERFANTTPSQQEIRDAVIEIRAKKFPDWRVVGTAGSFFKNPIIRTQQYSKLQEEYPDMPNFPVGDDMVKIPLGWVLDKVCKIRGMQKGNVGTYEGQALVLINHGCATAHEIETFARDIARDVKEKTNITVEWEVTRIPKQ